MGAVSPLPVSRGRGCCCRWSLFGGSDGGRSGSRAAVREKGWRIPLPTVLSAGWLQRIVSELAIELPLAVLRLSRRIGMGRGWS